MAMVGPAVLKFTLAAGALTFRADVNMHAAQALIDPAVTMTAVSEDYARRLHLRRTGHVSVRGLHGMIEADTAGPIDIRLGHSWFRVPRVLIAPLPGLAEVAGKADIVIGADALATTHMSIDFDKAELAAISDSDFAHVTAKYEPVALSKDAEGRRHITVRIGAGPPMDAVLDFAGAIPVVMSERTRSENHLGETGPVSTGLVPSPSGLLPSTTFSIPAMTVHGAALNDVPAAVTSGQVAALTLGLPIFEQYRVILDLGHDRIWLQPGKPKPFDRDLVGLTVTRQNGALAILHVAAHSPAQAAGLKAGQQITAINGKTIDDSYYASGLWRWMFGEPDGKLALTIDATTVTLNYRRFD